MSAGRHSKSKVNLIMREGLTKNSDSKEKREKSLEQRDIFYFSQLSFFYFDIFLSYYQNLHWLLKSLYFHVS